MIEPKKLYYIFNDCVYSDKADIIESEVVESYMGLDDDLSDWEPEGIEEVSGIELLERLEEEDLCLMI